MVDACDTSLGVRIPCGQPKWRRWPATVTVLVLVGSALACSAHDGGTSSAATGGTPTAPSAVSIPTGNLDAFAQCMVDLGWQITAVHSPGPGDPGPGYDMRYGGTMDRQELTERTNRCYALRPSPRPLTEAEIREIYYRWVDEYRCLLGLGYQPDGPPSVEAFVASYNAGNHKSPWMPIDGIDTDHWTQSQYDEAKAKCTLEFFTAEGLPQ